MAAPRKVAAPPPAGSPWDSLAPEGGLLASGLSSAAAGASVLAAAAPMLCAVHCAAMPAVAILLPSLQMSGKFCGHGLARKIAYYFVLPCGLLANAQGYREHG